MRQKILNKISVKHGQAVGETNANRIFSVLSRALRRQFKFQVSSFKNWGGILEARGWIWISENLRIVATAFAVIIFSEIYQPSALLFGLLAMAVFSIFWTFAYFRPNSPKLAAV